MKKVVLIGYGNIGKKHESAIASINDLMIQAIVDPMIGIEQNKYNSLDAFIQSEDEADIAAICTPNGQHADQAIACMKKGMHVLIEKPMAINKASAERVLATALETNTKVFCVMQLRYSPIVVWLKNILSNKLLGDIYSIEVRCFWNRNENYYRPAGQLENWRGSMDQDRGPLYTQFSHFVDLVYYLLGAWKVNAAVFNNFNHQDYTDFEDSGKILFDVGNTSGIFSYTTSVFEKNYESTITLIGSKGTVSIGGQYFNQIRYAHPERLPKINLEALDTYKSDRLAGHVAMYQNVLDALDAKSPITTNALDGLKVVEMIEEVYGFRDKFVIDKKN